MAGSMGLIPGWGTKICVLGPANKKKKKEGKLASFLFMSMSLVG